MRRLVFVMALLLTMAVAAGVIAAPPPKDTPVKVVINGSAKALKPAAFMRGSKVYVPLYAVAKELKDTVRYDSAKKQYVVTAGGKNTTIRESEGIKANGAFMVTSETAAKAFNCSVSWSSATKTLNLKAKASSTCPPGLSPKPGGG